MWVELQLEEWFKRFPQTIKHMTRNRNPKLSSEKPLKDLVRLWARYVLVRFPNWLPEASGLGNLTRSHLPKTISCAQSCIGHECFTQLFQRQSVSETPEAHCIEFHWLALFGWRTLNHPVRNQLTMKDWLGRDDPTRWFRFVSNLTNRHQVR